MNSEANPGDAASGDPAAAVLKASGIPGLNPVQKAAIDAGLLKGENLVVAAPTASGKTLVAEMAILNKLSERKKAVYIVPLKALGSEKHAEFRRKYEPLGIRTALSIGDLDSSDPWLANYDIIIVTSEKLDSLLRHGAPWLESVGLVVADEIHLIDSPNRGPTLEVLLTRLMQLINPQILALSATIRNHAELAEWLGAKSVVSDYRPVMLYKGLMHGGEVSWEPEKPALKVRPDMPPAFELAKDTVSIGKQALMFVSTRKRAESLAEKLGPVLAPLLKPSEKEGLVKLSYEVSHALEHPTRQCERLGRCLQKGAVFHHAGLVSAQRKLIEDGFRKGLIKIISATPTLAMGVNLPSYRVIIRDVKRFSSFKGMDYIPVLEVQQMCIPGNEKILLIDGKEIPIEKIKVSDKVLTYNISNGELQSSEIEKTYVREADTLIEVETSDGQRLRATREHPVLIKNHKGLSWLGLSELKPGMRLATLKGNAGRQDIYFFDVLPDSLRLFVKDKGELIAEVKKRLLLSDKILAERLGIDKKRIYHYRKNKRSIPLGIFTNVCIMLGMDKDGIVENMGEIKTAYGKFTKFPKFIGEDFLWLAGIILTDGNMQNAIDRRTGSRYCRIGIFNTNEKIIKKAKRVLNELGLKPYIGTRGGGCYSVECGSNLLAEILNKKFGIPFGKKARDTTIPEFVRGLRRNLIGAFIAGIFDGDGSFLRAKRKRGHSYRILFTTSSRNFAFKLKDLHKELFIESRIVEHKNKETIIRGKKARFSGTSYFVLFNKIEYIRKFAFFVRPEKCDMSDVEYSKYHNIDKHFNRGEDIEFRVVKSVREEQIKNRVKVYNIKTGKNENYFASNFLVHNCGRAGRPQYDTEGEAIIIASDGAEAKKMWDQYIKGEPEDVISKLGVEPVLRMHVLSLVAASDGMTREALLGFFSRTFYAHQYRDMTGLAREIDKVLVMLEEFGFISRGKAAEAFGDFRSASSLLERATSAIEPTRIGKRVAELYIDPLSANHIIGCLKAMRENGKTGEVSMLDVITRCLEMKPGVGVKKADMEKGDGSDTLLDFLLLNHGKLVGEIPGEWDMEYDEFIRSVKLNFLLSRWMDEATEDGLLEAFGVAPGELRARLEIADWLFYSMQELAHLLSQADLLKHIRKARLRLRYGIREELLPLVKLRGIGRARARMLFSGGLTTLERLREAPVTAISQLVGPAIAKSVKEQLSGPVAEKGRGYQRDFGGFGE